MKPAEFAMVLGWLFLPPLVAGFLLLLACSKRSAGFTWGRLAQASALMVLLVVPLMVGLRLVLPYWLLVRDTPILWSPMAWMALALALPVACRWARR